MFKEDEMLMLSGIQHYMFCPRQWALIHIEQQWEDNKLTVEGQLLHKNVDNPFYRQKNGDVITLRSVHIASKELGLYGITDAIELKPTDNLQNAITYNRYKGYWSPFPVEYKRGHSKPDERDEVQLAAQAICLEEMYGINILFGAIYYNEVRHREEIEITPTLRETTKECAYQMHHIFHSGTMPKAIKTKNCKNCSLKDVCIPELEECTKVKNYLTTNLYENLT